LRGVEQTCGRWSELKENDFRRKRLKRETCAPLWGGKEKKKEPLVWDQENREKRTVLKRLENEGGSKPRTGGGRKARAGRKTLRLSKCLETRRQKRGDLPTVKGAGRGISGEVSESRAVGFRILLSQGGAFQTGEKKKKSSFENDGNKKTRRNTKGSPGKMDCKKNVQSGKGDGPTVWSKVTEAEGANRTTREHDTNIFQ